MAINFPDSPTVGQEFTVGTVVYEWTGSVWKGTTPTEFPPADHTHLLEDITDYTPPVIPEVTFTNTFMLMGA